MEFREKRGMEGYPTRRDAVCPYSTFQLGCWSAKIGKSPGLTWRFYWEWSIQIFEEMLHSLLGLVGFLTPSTEYISLEVENEGRKDVISVNRNCMNIPQIPRILDSTCEI